MQQVKKEKSVKNQQSNPGGDAVTASKRPRTPQPRRLRRGFSTGTAATAAAVAALRHLLTGIAPPVVAVRLPSGCWLAIPIKESLLNGKTALAGVIKDGGDDPDVTHGAEVRATVRCVRSAAHGSQTPAAAPVAGLCVIGGEGVGVVGKPGLPVAVGEPAINPVPRQMLQQNILDELRRWDGSEAEVDNCELTWSIPPRPYLLLSYPESPEGPENLLVEVEISIPKGAALARHTLNPRLGIEGGLSVLGTTGIVRPFSHEAYEETIEAALAVAAAKGCREVVLSTGGKSERYAMHILFDRPAEAFVQIADFYAYAVRKARSKGFDSIVHSVFFGKVLKMGQGHAYTHAHRVTLELQPLAEEVVRCGYPETLSRQVAQANTARQALQLLVEKGAGEVIRVAARAALEQSMRLTEGQIRVRVLLFDYDGTLLADVH